MAASAVLVGSILLFAPRALAGPFISIDISLTGQSKVGACTSGLQTWELHADVSVFNGSSKDQDVTLASRRFPVRGLTESGSSDPTDATVIDDGGFSPGLVIPNDDQTHTYSVVVDGSIPCDSLTGNLAAAAALVEGGEEFQTSPDATSWDTGVPPTIHLFLSRLQPDPTWTDCSSGLRTWTVHEQIGVESILKASTLSYANVVARYVNAQGHTREADATITDDGGFVAGAVIQPTGTYHTFDVTMTTDLPCTPDPGDAWVVAQVKIQGGDALLATTPYEGGFTWAALDVNPGNYSQPTTSSSCTSGQRTWDVYPQVRLANDSFGPQTITITSIDESVRYHDATGDHTSSDVTLVDDGGFGVGGSISSGQAVLAKPHFRVTLPCDPDPDQASITIQPHSDIGDQNEVATFAVIGTSSVPLGTIGMIGLAALLALGFGLAQARSRRRTVSV